MAQLKTETLNLRVTLEFKELVRVAADRQHRTISNFVEALVRDYCECEGLPASHGETPRAGQGRQSRRGAKA